MSADATQDRAARIRELYARRRVDPFVRGSLAVVAVAMLAAWGRGFDVGDLFSERRRGNLARFLGELRPFPLQGEAWSWEVATRWAGDLLAHPGLEAATATLAISILAILLAGAGATLLSLPAARNFATPELFVPEGPTPGLWARAPWQLLRLAVRGLLTGMRAVPEYVWAFLLLAIFGPTAWPAILALAIHNTGILGRLGSETVENSPTATPAALRLLGAGRIQIAAFGLFPALLPRLLLYFFYRWETCVREATVLGMLGISSLGFWVEDARTRGHYDSLAFLVGLGVAIVLVGDLLSAVARRAVRNAG